ncbi:arsenate reductase (glutaredoxin) [Lentisalinibacter salinarum]|uniref:arsenate reductase (glutaredoxin) n=1 Tax=Lentisalinibacter salinarum TaxID=2992239 RepID=UPI00386E07B6
MNYRIYHNPRCSKSRATLALLEEAGVAVTVTEYLKEPPDAATLLRITELLGCRPQDLIRRNDPDYRSERETVDALADDAAAAWLAAHPAAIERPIVVRDDDAAAIGRPPENVHGILRT